MREWGNNLYSEDDTERIEWETRNLDSNTRSRVHGGDPRVRSRIDHLESELAEYRDLLNNRLISSDQEARMTAIGRDVLESLHRHMSSHSHRGSYRDAEPRALIWIIEKMNHLDRKFDKVIEIFSEVKAREKDGTDDVLSELKKIINE